MTVEKREACADSVHLGLSTSTQFIWGFLGVLSCRTPTLDAFSSPIYKAQTGVTGCMKAPNSEGLRLNRQDGLSG